MPLVISNSVGTGGVNLPDDVIAVKQAFNQIPTEMGAPAEVLTEDAEVTSELIDAIVNFQLFHTLPAADGLISVNKATHKRINLVLEVIAAPDPTANVAPVPSSYAQSVGPESIYVVDPLSLPGVSQMLKKTVPDAYERRLVFVTGSSIKWYGVVLPKPLPSDGNLGVLHVNFTPTPAQGGYSDATYETFTGWYQLWDDYTSIIGSQMIASGARQVLVIPFYKTAQQMDLGSFLFNWRAVMTAVVSVAVDSVDAFYLSSDFSFSRMVSSSFSNGWVAHKGFNTGGLGVAATMDFIFDLDGQAGGSTWAPPNGVIYRNLAPPASGNPSGNIFFVGGRWSQFASLYPAGSFNTHATCRNHLLYHGLFTFCV